MNIELVEAERLSARQEEALGQLSAAVYPQEVTATLPGRFFTWASPQWSILLWEGDELVTQLEVLCDIKA
jgi:hypothetical protein